jgi:micrococcal nuclease
VRVLPRALAVLSVVAGLTIPVMAAPPAGAATRPQNVPKNAVEVKVKKIVSGDSLDVVTTKGVTVRVGLLEADAFEKDQCWYAEAVARLSELLPVGKTAYVLPEQKQMVQKDRLWLLYAWSAKGTYVNGDMVRNGLAQAVAYDPEHKYTASQFEEQEQAQAAQVGMWSPICWATNTYDKRDAGAVAVPPALAVPARPAEPYELTLTLSSAAPAPSSAPRPTTKSTTSATPTPAPAPIVTKTPKPAPAPAPAAAPASTRTTDPRFPTCAEANAHGYGPYRRGFDPEYAWYIDQDSDGIVCER